MTTVVEKVRRNRFPDRRRTDGRAYRAMKGPSSRGRKLRLVREPANVRRTRMEIAFILLLLTA